MLLAIHDHRSSLCKTTRFVAHSAISPQAIFFTSVNFTVSTSAQIAKNYDCKFPECDDLEVERCGRLIDLVDRQIQIPSTQISETRDHKSGREKQDVDQHAIQNSK